MYITSKNLDNYSYKSINNIQNKRVIVRSCLNVSVDNTGKIKDDTRLLESMELINELAGKVRKLIIMGHLGRPEPRSTEEQNVPQEVSFWHVAEAMQTKLKSNNLSVKLCKSLDQVENSGDQNCIYLIENIRSFDGEESKNLSIRKSFAQRLAALADIYINDAFADYRESASTYDIAQIIPAYIGPAFLREVMSLGKFSNPARPFVAILGGAKLSEKLDALNSLAETADKVIIGGAMAYTLMKAQNIPVGKSLVEDEKLAVASEIINKYSNKLILPVDHMISTEFKETSEHSVTANQIIPEDKLAIDLGSKTIDLIKKEIANASSILWNGPMGVTEWEHSAAGTKAVGMAIQENTKAYALAGGGDSITAINKYKLSGFDHISTGGGAMLAFLAYNKFPTLDVILQSR